MGLTNFERMIQLAEDVFAVRTDPDQLDVNEEVLERLRRLHPATLSEFDDGNGPVAWVLVVPTTTDIMNRFLQHKITEKDILNLTPVGDTFDALYLCSALVLEEYRHQGIAKRLTIDAIENIQKDHPLKTLFVWSFTKEGEKLASNVAHQVSLPLLGLKKLQ